MWKTKFKKCIYTSPSGYKVYQNRWYRWLTFSGKEYQTLINRKHPEKPELNYIAPMTLAMRTLPGSCCLLGIGGASALHLLKQQDAYDSITAIDSSAEVIEIANKYFHLSKIPRLNIIEDTAEHFLQETTSRYKHLIIDIYQSDAFPSNCLNQQFFQDCKDVLEPDGILSINIANRADQQPIVQFIKNLFGHNTLYIPVQDCMNAIMIASNAQSRLLDALRQGTEVEQIQWVSPIGHVAWMK